MSCIEPTPPPKMALLVAAADARAEPVVGEDDLAEIVERREPHVAAEAPVGGCVSRRRIAVARGQLHGPGRADKDGGAVGGDYARAREQKVVEHDLSGIVQVAKGRAVDDAGGVPGA